MDTRWRQLAEILVQHSTQVRRGERVMIDMKEVESLPLPSTAWQRWRRSRPSKQTELDGPG